MVRLHMDESHQTIASNKTITTYSHRRCLTLNHNGLISQHHAHQSSTLASASHCSRHSQCMVDATTSAAASWSDQEGTPTRTAGCRESSRELNRKELPRLAHRLIEQGSRRFSSEFRRVADLSSDMLSLRNDGFYKRLFLRH